MSLITLLVALIVVGILLWAFNTYVTFVDARIKQIVNVIVIVVVILWLLQVFGLFAALGVIKVPTLH